MKKINATLTTNNVAQYLVIWAYWGNQSIALNTLQLEEDSVATSYEPYYITSDTTVTEWNKPMELKAIWE